MSYPSEKDEDFEKDLLSRKEFFSYKNDPERNFRGVEDDLAGKYLKMHSSQLFVRNFMNPNTNWRGLHLQHGTGCHAAGTEVIMADGSLRAIEDVRPGDILMGDDFTPRFVLGTTRGEELMYEIVPLDGGDTFVVNFGHIIYFFLDGAPRALTIGAFLELSYEEQTRALLARVIYAGNGHRERRDAYAAGAAAATFPQHFDEFRRAALKSRQEFIHGIVDTYGVFREYGAPPRFILSLEHEYLKKIKFIANSAGIHAKFVNCGRQLEVYGGKYTTTRFYLRQMSLGKYYGVTLSGNHLFLAADFTVLHNTGKTLAAVAIAQEFIKSYTQIYAYEALKYQYTRKNYIELDHNTPTVFVLGFAGPKAAFIRELLRHHQFGFVSITEQEEFLKRRRLAEAGLPDDIKQYKEYFVMLKKRITNKSKGGFYKFYGYDKLVNKLFIASRIKLVDLENEVAVRVRAGEDITVEDMIYAAIERGDLKLNVSFINQCKNSLIICDEIHNTFNMNMKNNRGVAIQFILDSSPSTRIVTMSATPINNSPTEVIEFLNYLLPKQEKIHKKDFFSNNRNLRPGALERIGQLSRGRVSFLQDINTRYFPRREFRGEPIKLPAAYDVLPKGAAIPYLSFIPCPMSRLHQDTYNDFLHQLAAERDEPLDYAHTVPIDGYAIYDIVFPNPEDNGVGLFRSGKIKSKLIAAPQAWRDEKGVSIKKFSNNSNIISGTFLEERELAKYSSKYAGLVSLLKKIIVEANERAEDTHKVMIYHDWVKSSGVLLIQEILRMNNFLDEFSEPVDTTLCCICGRALLEHKKTRLHSFRPARFVMAHSDIDKSTMDQSLTKYNAADNAYGHNYMILVGSQIIRESYDFKNVRDLILCCLSTNIPTTLQVFGRCIRKNAHADLVPENRVVKISILLTVVNESYPYEDPSGISPEMYRCVNKVLDYKIIQAIEREMIRWAIDANIHRDIIMPPELYEEYFPDGNGPIDRLGNLYFEPAVKLEEVKLNLATFNAYEYYTEEIAVIMMIIKRLFTRRAAWTYDDLWAAVRAPPFGVEVNPALFGENNFIVALSVLVDSFTNIIDTIASDGQLTEAHFIDKIFDPNERYIYIGRQKYRLAHIDKYYILFPMRKEMDNPLASINASTVSASIKDKEKMIIRDFSTSEDRVNIDAETYLRRMNLSAGIYIDLAPFVAESKSNINYDTKKKQLLAQYMQRDEYSYLVDYNFRFQAKFLEEVITTPRKSHSPLHKRVLHVFTQFHVLVFAKEVKKYKDVVKQFSKLLDEVDDNEPIGYMMAKYVRLYDAAAKRWFEVSKVALNRQLVYRENNVIVGYFEEFEDKVKFKLRKPLIAVRSVLEKSRVNRELKSSNKSYEHKIAKAMAGDTRLIESGMVCMTKNKQELMSLCNALGIKRASGRRKELCEAIFSHLIKEEIRECEAKSRIKYIYGFWDELPQLAFTAA